MLALLKLPDGTPVSKKTFLETNGLLEENTREAIKKASCAKLVQDTEGYIQISQKSRFKIVTKCLEKGIDVESVCKAAGWREFEDLAVMILGANGYVTKKHFRFRFNEKGYEVDVLALKSPWSLAVECKRWKRSLQPAARKRVAEIHQKKISSLRKALPSLFNRYGLNIFHDVKLIPTVLTLFETPLVIEHGIPFVPIRRFQSFIEQFEGYVGDFEINNHR